MITDYLPVVWRKVYPSLSPWPPLLAYSASVAAAERMVSVATLTPIPQLRATKTMAKLLCEHQVSLAVRY